MAAIVVHAETAISGLTTSLEAVGPEVNAEDLPYLTVLQTQYEVEEIDWGQERRVWTVSGALYQDGSTREALHLKLEAFRDAIFGDKQLGGLVDRASLADSVPDSNPDSHVVMGFWAVRAEKVT
eukprot:GHVR01056790.1.p1 GENE.GHVR01056790.1~~GHVR01056790.1.p1  ORF type:complete len:124 (+),score=29.36 GHVR01056790.1:200-571(+)